MRKLFTALFLLLIVSSLTFSQWAEQTSGVATALYSVSAVDNNNVWICGAAGKVLRTTNAGILWSTAATPNAAIDLYCICGVDASTALVTGSSSTATFVYKTTNAGANWTQVFTQTGGFIDAILQIDSQEYSMYGDPVGGRWSLWRSTNSGSSWDSTGGYIPQAGSEAGWNNSAVRVLTGFMDDVIIWFGTNNTRVYRFSAIEGVITTTIQPTTGLVNSASIWFNDTLKGMTGEASLMSTTNGGTNWSAVTGAPGSGNILGITGSGNNWLYVRGSGIYYSSNNGANWSTNYTVTSGTFDHITMSRTGTSIWAIRNNGGISYTPGPIGIKPISSEVPKSYLLYQNYPNPFNPGTTIKFALPQSSFTILTIYDALGREISRLVNEKLSAGTYEVDWNGSNYSSGLYFYKIQTENYQETKRMLMIK